MRNRFFKLSLLTCALILSISTFSVAQDLDNVTISGKVTDSNNQIILGATVTAKFITTGIERSVQTDDEGRYRLINLPPGSYKLKVTAANFAPQETKELTTVAAQNVQFNFSLKPGEVSGAVEVVAGGDEALAVDTTRTIVAGTLTTQQIEELPNTDRNALNLVLTLGGTSEEAGSVKDLADDRGQNSRTPPAEQGNFSLSGGTSYSNNITIDGFDNNDDRAASDRFQPSIEAIQEVQVVKNQFSSEYGRASGGRVNIAIKTGTNKFHGRVYGNYRDNNFNANSWYNNSRRLDRPSLVELNPGFNFGGPVIIPFGEGKSIYDGHNKTFFFVNYEYLKLRDTTLVDTYVPVVGNPRFSLPAGNAACIALSGVCTDQLSGAAISPYRSFLITPNLTHSFTSTLKHIFNDKNDIVFGLTNGRKNNKRTNGTTVTRLDDAVQAKISQTTAYNINYNHTFNSNLINNFRSQYSIFTPSFQTDAPDDPVVLIAYRAPTTNSLDPITISSTLITGNSTSSVTGVSSAFAQARKEKKWQFVDSLTYVTGRHTLIAGFDTQSIKSVATVLTDATGTFNFANVLDYQQNRLSRYRQNYGNFQDVKNTYYGFFLQDGMRLFSNLTLNYGLRYERETAVSDNNNFGPRLGMAWGNKKGNGVVRFGAGIFYNKVLLRTVGDSIQNTNSGLISFDTNTIGTGATDSRRIAILAAIAQQFPNNYASIADLQSLAARVCPTVVLPLGPCTSTTGTTGNVSTSGNPLRSVEPNLRIPESYQFNIGYERDLGKGFVFEANYTWNKTSHLWRDSNPNAPRLPSGFADWTAYLRANPYTFTNTNGTVRTYQFYLGSTTDTTGVSTSQTTQTACSTTTAVTCFVNLNTTSISSTAPASAVTGLNGNSVGGPIGLALAAIARFRPDQTVEETSRIGSRGSAFYQGLVVELRSRRHNFGGFGTTFRSSYTLSSTKDDGLNNTANAEIDGDFNREWARSVQDRRHAFALAGTFDMPKWLGKLRFSPLVRWKSSNPFGLGDGGSDRNLDDVGTDRLNFSGNLKDIVFRKPGSAFPIDLAKQFALAPIGAKSGNLPRNAGTGPSFYLFDLSVTREFKINERIKFRPNIQFGNILNAAVFSYGGDFIDFSGLGDLNADPSTLTATQISNRANFLVPSRTYRQRDIRLGFRLDF
jgi:hypothetical protein